MFGIMQDRPLLISSIITHAERFHSETAIVSRRVEGDLHRTDWGTIAKRAKRMAGALDTLAIAPGSRVATLAWNGYRHLETYFGVSGSQRVLHTLNPRLSPQQLTWIVNHAGDEVVCFDTTFLPLVEAVCDQCPTVKHWIAYAAEDQLPATTKIKNLLSYEALLEASSEVYEWPIFDEQSASSMCYTSGTTGNPKGVVYTHRSTFLHTMAAMMTDGLGVSERDSILPVVPMFHANSWGLAHAAVAAGANLVMPGPDLSGKAVADLIVNEKVTIAAGVPTIWMGVLPELKGRDTSSLRVIPCGGSAVPRALSEAYREQTGLPILQAWGMTETSPLAAICHLDSDQLLLDVNAQADLRTQVGRIMFGVECRVVEPGTTTSVPWDGESSGELQCRGNWIAATYYNDERAGESFTDDGWLRTGDVAAVDVRGRIRLLDRTKDLIKSGGEWISSVELENELMAHPLIREAAVIGVMHPRWSERPLACVVLEAGAVLSKEEILEFIASKVAKWQVPDDVVFINEVPKTSVGKFSKKTLRERFENYQLPTA